MKLGLKQCYRDIGGTISNIVYLYAGKTITFFYNEALKDKNFWLKYLLTVFMMLVYKHRTKYRSPHLASMGEYHTQGWSSCADLLLGIHSEKPITMLEWAFFRTLPKMFVCTMHPGNTSRPVTWTIWVTVKRSISWTSSQGFFLLWINVCTPREATSPSWLSWRSASRIFFTQYV